MKCPEGGVNLGKLEGLQGLAAPVRTRADCDFTGVFILFRTGTVSCYPRVEVKMLSFDTLQMKNWLYYILH